jgi:cytochrome c556
MAKWILGTGMILVSTTLLFTTHAQQQEPTPAEIAASAAETRQAIFKLLSYNMGSISGMARGTIEFDSTIAERNANRISALAPMIPELFSVRDTRAFNVETEALPIIWERMEEFREKAANLEAAANTFAQTARAGDRNSTIAAVRAFGGTCGNCHETFRVD